MEIIRIIKTFTLLGMLSLASAQHDIPIKLTGEITHPNSDSIVIKNSWGEQFHVIELDEIGQFFSTFEIEEGYYSFYDKKEQDPIYLGEDYVLNLTLKTDSFDESIRYSGYGADANNYLAAKALMREKWG